MKPGPAVFHHALILCNGEPPPRSLCLKLAGRADLIVAADGGANTARQYGITPNVIIGDLDSIKPATRRFFSSVKFVRVTRQDNTDLEKALDYVADNGITTVTIAGATGRRIDFTLGNLSVLWNYTSSFRIIVAGNLWRALPITREISVHAARGTKVSIIPFGQCGGVTLKGLRYPLRNATLRVGEIGVSNVVVRSPFSVRVKKGKLLLIVFDQISQSDPRLS
jgi:thiamine pyrophosphokinase